MFTYKLLWSKKHYEVFRYVTERRIVTCCVAEDVQVLPLFHSRTEKIFVLARNRTGKQLLLKEQTALPYPCKARVRGVPMIQCGSAPRLAARAGYDRWAEPPLINNTLVALLHNLRPLVPFAGSSGARRVVTAGPALVIGSSVTVDYFNRAW